MEDNVLFDVLRIADSHRDARSSSHCSVQASRRLQKHSAGGDGGLKKRIHYLVQVGTPVFFMYVVCQTADVLHPIGVHKSLRSEACRRKYAANEKSVRQADSVSLVPHI